MQQQHWSPLFISALPVVAPCSLEQEDEIRELQLEIADLRDLVRDLLTMAALPEQVVVRAYRLIGEDVKQS